MNAWDDPRIARGMEKQLADRAARIAAGEKPIGWKVGLGAKAAMERLAITMPVVGYMMQKSVVPTAAPSRSRAGSSRSPSRRSPSIWRRISRAGRGRDDTIAAIGALGPAIELADLRARRPTSRRCSPANIFIAA
jgi:2-keto-4-pentenoate hydratase